MQRFEAGIRCKREDDSNKTYLNLQEISNLIVAIFQPHMCGNYEFCNILGNKEALMEAKCNIEK